MPLVAAFLITFFGKKLPMQGWELAFGSIAFVGVYGTVLFFLNATEGIVYEGTIKVADIGSYAIEWDGWSTVCRS